MRAAIIILLLTSQSAAADYWLTASLALHATDWLQTREIAKNDNYIETNPLLDKKTKHKTSRHLFYVNRTITNTTALSNTS